MTNSGQLSASSSLSSLPLTRPFKPLWQLVSKSNLCVCVNSFAATTVTITVTVTVIVTADAAAAESARQKTHATKIACVTQLTQFRRDFPSFFWLVVFCCQSIKNLHFFHTINYLHNSRRSHLHTHTYTHSEEVKKRHINNNNKKNATSDARAA